MFVKICCIKSLDEAALAIRMGADALGLVGEMPSGPGVIDDATARDIAAHVGYRADTFLLTSRERGADIVDHVKFCGTSTVQVVRHVDPGELETIQALLPGVRRVQVIHVEDESAIALAAMYEPFVDAILLDSGRPGLEVAELGGTGRAHNWEISAALVRAVSVPVYLAGGLGPDNVAEAIEQVRPAGVDLCSGVRTANELDAGKLERYVQAVRSG